MIFNSIEFTVFLIIIFSLYWFALNRNLKLQNAFLLVAGYVFYTWWDWRFLFLLISVSLINYFIGIRIGGQNINEKKKLWLITGLIVDIGVLCIFKYFNFFIETFIDLLSNFGYTGKGATLRIILPVGISFYLFLCLSYIIDIYKGIIQPHRNIIELLLTLSFFPIILAGPIQRPSTLLPQIASPRVFYKEHGTDGLRQILWGLFMKVVIADKLNPIVGDIFNGYSEYSGSTLLLGAGLYAIQIYADFAGYSNIAIGTGKLFGFNLMRNFAFPYFARDISEFWKRWHISLTSWFRDYVFLPLSFSISWRIKGNKVLFIRSDIFIYIIASIFTWLLTGLWHGANYTYIVWGLLHGFLLIIFKIQQKYRKSLFKKIGIDNNNNWIIIPETIITLIFVMLIWIFFRAENLTSAMKYLKGIFSTSLFSVPQLFPAKILLLIVLMLLFEWIQKTKEHALQIDRIKPAILRFAIYYSLTILIFIESGTEQSFIYFQF